MKTALSALKTIGKIVLGAFAAFALPLLVVSLILKKIDI